MNKHIARKAAFAVKNLAIIYSLGREPMVYNMAAKRPVFLTGDVFDALHCFHYQWTVYTAVALENSLGERYMSINECSPAHRCRKDAIADTLKEAHMAQIKKAKRMDLRNVGWVGFPRPRELPEKQVTELLELNPNLWDEYQRGEFVIEESELTIDQQLERLL